MPVCIWIRSLETSQLRISYYSAQACGKTLVKSLFPHSLNPMGRLSDMTGEGSGAESTNDRLKFWR